MKWVKGAKQGIIVAGNQAKGDHLTHVYYPKGVLSDRLGTVYVADANNYRIVRWPKDAKEGNIIVGGNGYGAQANQFHSFSGLSFDRHGNLYVVDNKNNRVQRFTLEIPSNYTG
ncbi:unnamed protein product [Rotaria sordida]|uniref:Uncharacterized protein n=1 Tax=Rotaria sordida TaxID=392033 RepID=A0A815TR29_9BILA|nr:unnamed protein product [Rotaria sordida]CAF4183711.1 unnamed protein product [Rotaria sordida]